MNLKKSYNIEPGPVADSMDSYASIKNEEYKSLLNSATSEKELQKYFERNPSFVPGAWTPGSKSGHSPLHCALITQPKLSGLTTRIPDFMWISTHSLAWYPTLIEIENPNKRLFKNDGTPTAEFTQARNQLQQWKTWFNEPSNVIQFEKMYGIPDQFKTHRQMELHTILVYGRRSEFENTPSLSKERHSLTSQGIELMSFDRLSCDKDLSDAVTVKLNKNNEYEVITVPTTFQQRPVMADRLCHLHNMDLAIMNNNEFTPARKEFLLERLPYWENWAKNGSRGITNIGDCE